MNPKLHEIEKLIEKQKIKDAILQIRKLIEKTQALQYNIKLDEINLTYSQLINYFSDDVIDNQRDEVIHFIKLQLQSIAKSLLLDYDTRHSSWHYYQLRRIRLSDDKYDIKSLVEDITSSYQNRKQYDRLIIKLFNLLMIQDSISSEETALLFDLDDTYLQSVVVSGLMMGLLESWDISKAEYIFKALIKYREVEIIRSRCIMTLVLSIIDTPLSYQLYQHKLASLWQFALSEDEYIMDDIRFLITKIYINWENENVSKRVQETLQENLKNVNVETLKKISKIDTEDLLDSENELEKSVDENLEALGLDKIQEELLSLRDQGADLAYGSFKPLKNYPFFKELSNWFLPWDINHSELQNLSKEAIANVFDKMAHTMCSSDTYSFALTLAMAPTQFQQNTAEMMGADIGMNKSIITHNTNHRTIEIAKCIDNHYRLNKLWQDKSQLWDIFDTPIIPNQKLPFIGDAFRDQSFIINLIEILLYRQNRISEAIELIQYLLKECDCENNILLEKLAICYQKNGNFLDAVETYLQIYTENESTLRHIAECYQKAGKFQEAINYYQKLASKSVATNHKITLRIISCLIGLGHWQEALTLLSEVNTSDNNYRVMKLRALCLLYLSDIEEAEQIYKYLINEKNYNADANDYINYGHCALKNKHIKYAIKQYKNAISQVGKDDFIKIWKEDQSLLMEKLAIPYTDVSLIYDALI